MELKTYPDIKNEYIYFITTTIVKCSGCGKMSKLGDELYLKKDTILYYHKYCLPAGKKIVKEG